MKVARAALFCIVNGCLALQVSAQTTPPATLKEAVERAILQNPEVKLRFHNLNAAQEERRTAEAGWLPRVDLEAASGTYGTLKPSLASTENYSGNRASLQLRQMLFDGLATRNEVRRLSYAQQASYFELQTISQQTGLEATRAYVDTLRYRELLALAQDNYTTHQEVHDRLAQKVKAGVGRRVDLEQAAGRLALAESNWLTEVSNLHDVSARYQRLVGDTPAESLARLDPIDAYLPLGTDFLGEAVLKNPDFQGAVATIRAYRADLQSKRSLSSPTVELRARQSFETNQTGVMGDYRDTALEVVLNYNLYRGGADSARTQQYAAKLQSAYDLRDKACRDIWQTGQIALNDSQKLAAQIKLLAQHELSTSKARQAYQQQFDIGQRSLLDLLDTENELYQARRALSNAEYDLQLSSVRMLAVSGGLLGALKLQALANETPDASGNTEEDDDLMQCSTQVAANPTLDRTFNSRPANSPQEPVKPVAAVVPVSPNAVCMELPKVVEDWLAAWNRKDLTAYLATYADSFVPANKMKRKPWEAMRKARITKQGDLQIVMGKVVPIQCDAKTAEVSFPQEYGSIDYKDKVEKTLSLEKVKGVWKITKETVTKGRTY